MREVVRSKPKNVQEKSGETTRDRPMMRTRRIYRGVAKATKGTKKSRTKHSVHQFFCPIAINTKRMPRISAGRKGKNITRVSISARVVGETPKKARFPQSRSVIGAGVFG